MIEKPTILITSLGRTGTEFFAKFFKAILPAATALHEPDIFQNTGLENKWGHYLQQVQLAGIWRMVILKGLGKWTLIKLSDDKFLNRLSSDNAVQGLLSQRSAFVHNMLGSVYVEANIGYYGLLDVTPRVFEQHRAVYIIRDGREWVRSHMNWGEFYGKKGIRKLISHNWPPANKIPNNPYAQEWDGFSRFEKLCWAWTNLNQYALKTLSVNPHVKVFKFEDIFSGDRKYQTLEDMLAFTTAQPGIDPQQIGSTAGWLERRSHQSVDGFPGWENWTVPQKRQFEKLCSPLMDQMGYSLDGK
jgi:hypothetical protein